MQRFCHSMESPDGPPTDDTAAPAVHAPGRSGCVDRRIDKMSPRSPGLEAGPSIRRFRGREDHFSTRISPRMMIQCPGKVQR